VTRWFSLEGIAMKSHVLGFALLSASAIVASAPAQAQNGSFTRSFVSSTGVDTNPCTITAPCASFAQAYTKIGANGIVAALDPGKYGPIAITGPVTINGNGWAAITVQTNGSGITINASSGNVILIGLEIDGGGSTNSNGIYFEAGGTLEVLNSSINNLPNGILVEPISGSIHVFIKDTTVLNSSNAGIYVAPQQGAYVNVEIDQVTTTLNDYGMYFDATRTTTGGMETLIMNSHVMDNYTAGIYCTAGTQYINAIITNTTAILSGGDVTLNGQVGVELSGDKIQNFAGAQGNTGIPATSDGTNFIYNNVNQSLIINGGTK
jgi:hypothetical protein